jgi:hypothetical protein
MLGHFTLRQELYSADISYTREIVSRIIIGKQLTCAVELLWAALCMLRF